MENIIVPHNINQNVPPRNKNYKLLYKTSFICFIIYLFLTGILFVLQLVIDTDMEINTRIASWFTIFTPIPFIMDIFTVVLINNNANNFTTSIQIIVSVMLILRILTALVFIIGGFSYLKNTYEGDWYENICCENICCGDTLYTVWCRGLYLTLIIIWFIALGIFTNLTRNYPEWKQNSDLSNTRLSSSFSVFGGFGAIYPIIILIKNNYETNYFLPFFHAFLWGLIWIVIYSILIIRCIRCVFNDINNS